MQILLLSVDLIQFSYSRNDNIGIIFFFFLVYRIQRLLNTVTLLFFFELLRVGNIIIIHYKYSDISI